MMIAGPLAKQVYCNYAAWEKSYTGLREDNTHYNPSGADTQSEKPVEPGTIM